MAERDYALEMWRLLDPEAHLITSKQLLERVVCVVCVKSGDRKSLENVFQDGSCHPRMAMTTNAVPILCVARNVACNVRDRFFEEFDENLLRRISELVYEDEVLNLPSAPDSYTRFGVEERSHPLATHLSAKMLDELVSVILSCLPTTPLLRFIDDNKSWGSLITSFTFAYDHMARSRLRGNVLIKYADHTEDNCFYIKKLVVEDTSIVNLRILRVSVYVPDELMKFNLFGMTCSHGLVLIEDFCKCFIVWDVAPRKIKEISLDDDLIAAHFFQPPFYFVENLVGFTLTVADCDYKITRIHIFGDDQNRRIAHARVYSRLTGYWTLLNTTSFPGYESRSNVKKFAVAKKYSSLVVRGSLYWACELSAVLGLNLGNWAFSNLGWPQFDMPGMLVSVTLNRGERVFGGIAGRRLSQNFEIWIHSELGWVKRYLVQPPNVPLKTSIYLATKRCSSIFMGANELNLRCFKDVSPR